MMSAGSGSGSGSGPGSGSDQDQNQDQDQDHEPDARTGSGPAAVSTTGPPTLALMVGLPAAGKTTTARQLAERSHALVLSPDDWMIPLFGDSDGDGRRDVMEARLIRLGLDLLRLGVSVVLDFGFWGREERWSLLDLAHRTGAVGRVVYLPVDPQTQWSRVRRRWAEAPGRTFPLTEAELQRWRDQFAEPDRAELAGHWPDPPLGHESWWDWAIRRWPGLE